MHTGPSPSPSGQVQVGSVVALWRYPVKSMMGEELNACEVTDRGLLGDRRFAVVDRATGNVGGAKNPRKWGNFFDFRAAYAEPPRTGARISPVRITLPDGTAVTSGQPDLEQILSRAFGRDVEFAEARPGQMPSAATAEEYWPDMAGLDYRDTVTDFEMPAGTFFDIAVVHLLTTATINRLRALYQTAASRSGASAPTSSSRPAARMRALRKTTGSAARPRSAAPSAWPSPTPAPAA